MLCKKLINKLIKSLSIVPIVSQSRLDILHQLYETGEMSQRALQQQVNSDNAAITRHLKQLEERDVVSRRKNPDDNRVTFVKLYEKRT